MFRVFLWCTLSGEYNPAQEKSLFWSTMHHQELAALGAFLPQDFSPVKRFLSLSLLQLRQASSMRGTLPTFALLGKLADAIPGFADILVVEHSE